MLEALLRELEEPGNGRVFGISLDEDDFISRADPDAIIASQNRASRLRGALPRRLREPEGLAGAAAVQRRILPQPPLISGPHEGSLA